MEWKKNREDEAALKVLFGKGTSRMEEAKKGRGTITSFFTRKVLSHLSMFYDIRSNVDIQCFSQDCTKKDNENASADSTTPELQSEVVSVSVQKSTLPLGEELKEARTSLIQESQERVISHMCSVMAIDNVSLLTEDVSSHPEFMQALSALAVSYKDFISAFNQYQVGQSFVKADSVLRTVLDKANLEIEQIKQNLVELSAMTVLTTNLSVQIKSCQEKLLKMLALLPGLFSCKSILDNALMRVQSAVRAQKSRRLKKLTISSNYVIHVSNSLGLSWDEAIDKLCEVESIGGLQCLKPLSLEQMRYFINIRDLCTRMNFCGVPSKVLIEQYDLAKDLVREVVQQLVEFFPLLCVQSGESYVLVDLHELLFHPNFVHQLLTLDLPESDTELQHEQELLPQEGVFYYQKTGPISMQQKYPQLLTVMIDFIKLHGFAAHARRRTGTASSCGVRLEDVRQHVLNHVEGLESISRTKIYYLLKPARSNTRDAANHKDALDVRVGVKSADISKVHKDSHEYFASVKSVREFCALHPGISTIFSCDSKAKVHIGGQAVSRYHQLRKFFPSDDTPHYADHDFPISGYLIEPDGYLMLQDKNTSPEIVKDFLGRETVKVPSTGPLWIFNRCVKSTSTTIAHHTFDLRNIFAQNPNTKKPVLALITDGGPDWTPKSNLNEFFLGKLWEDEQLDMVISVCIPPGQSRFNAIEHVWSSCSRWLAGVSLSACLPGESVAPCEQNIPPEEKSEKEKHVFANAIQALNSYWNNKVHDGFRVSSLAGSDNSDCASEYTAVKCMFNSSLRRIKEDSQMEALLEKWRFYVKHMDRRNGMVVIRRYACGNQDCSCFKCPISANELLTLPSSDKWLFPPITPDSQHQGHYLGFLQLQRALSFSEPDQHLSSRNGVGSCNKCRLDIELYCKRNIIVCRFSVFPPQVCI
jgi:hypothetical protein